MSIEATKTTPKPSGEPRLLPKTPHPATKNASWTPTAFEQVFHGHYPRVASLILRVVGDRTKADDIANEVFWKLYR